MTTLKHTTLRHGTLTLLRDDSARYPLTAFATQFANGAFVETHPGMTLPEALADYSALRATYAAQPL